MTKATTSKASVLLVDDNADIRFLSRRVLEQAGLDVTEASGGVAALEMLERGLSPDLIVLDVQMPGMSGWDVLRTIREKEEGGRKRVPVLMCTVKTSPDSRKLGHDLGCNGYLGKPFRVSQLSRFAEELLPQRAPQAVASR